MNELNISAVNATAMETATTTSAPKHKWLTKLTRGAKKAYSVSLRTIEDGIPEDVSPDFLKKEDVFCTVYRIKDEYDNESKIFISNSDTLICFYQE